jgi:hypothetical protein
MPDVIDDERHDAVCDALATGLSFRAVASQFNMTEHEVRAVLREERRRCFDGEKLGEQVALEVRRVRAIALKYFNKGMELPNGELAAGIYFKGVERLMYMLGANAPQQYAVHLITQAAPERVTSTDRLRAALDRLDAAVAKTEQASEEEPASGPH